MCCGKIIRILHSRVEQFILSSRVHSISQWFSTFSLKGAKSRSTILWESGTKKNLAQVNSHVLFYCRTKSVTQHIFIDIARGPMGPFSSLTFGTVLCLRGGIPNKIVLTVWPPIFGWLRYWFYWKAAESCTEGAWEPHATFRKVVSICWWYSIWSDCGVLLETLIVAASSVVAKSVSNRTDL